MSEEKKIIIHIGPPKTGSTSIQDMLNSNQCQLAQQGFLYPLSGRVSEAGYYMVNRFDRRVKYRSPLNSHRVLAWSLDDRVEGLNADSVWQSLIEEIEASTTHTIILSAEAFAQLSKEKIYRIANYLKAYKVQIVAYKRDYLSHALSMYTQNVKRGRVYSSFGKFIRVREERLFDLPQIVSNWSEAFGKECFHIKNFDTIKKQGLTLDFLIYMGLSAEESASISSNTGKKNPSPSPSKIRLIRFVNGVEKLLGVPVLPRSWFERIRKSIMRSDLADQLSFALGHPLYTKSDEAFLRNLEAKAESSLSSIQYTNNLAENIRPL